MNQEANDIIPIFSVNEFLDYLNQVMTQRIYVIEGEISECNDHKTGVYCTLKDEAGSAVLSCYISTWRYKSISRTLEVGMKVRMHGAPSVYKPKGRLSFVVENFEYAGEGAHKLAYEALKKKLEVAGVFARKRKLPECIQAIGVVTSRTGAVIHDFRKNLASRGYRVFLFHTKVEGKDALEGISRGIDYFNTRQTVDVVAVMRGGGSLEDLEVFNSETLVGRVFASSIPVIGAIGHEKDVPLICLAADAAPSTPTAAAMLINATWDRVIVGTNENVRHFAEQIKDVVSNLREQVDLGVRMIAEQLSILRRLREDAEYKVRSVLRIMEEVIQQLSLRAKNTSAALKKEMVLCLKNISQRLGDDSRILEAKDPRGVILLGYSIARTVKGEIIKSISNVSGGDSMQIEVGDGIIFSTVSDKKKKLGYGKE